MEVALSLVDRGYTAHYDYPAGECKSPTYGRWRVYSPENTIRLYALRLHEEGATKPNP
jgi:NitT/TauT family transport system substrate-binding protein